MSDLTAQSQQVFSPEHPYESETIREINQCLESTEGRTLEGRTFHNITLHMIDFPDDYHHLDFMALGRALYLTQLNAANYLIATAYEFPKKYPEVTQQMLISYQVGRIAAEISARNNNYQNKFGACSWQPTDEAEFQKRLQDDHSTSVTCSTYHPDPTVREMAAWCAAHLTQIRGVQMGLIPPTPQPSPAQTPPPCPLG